MFFVEPWTHEQLKLTMQTGLWHNIPALVYEPLAVPQVGKWSVQQSSVSLRMLNGQFMMQDFPVGIALQLQGFIPPSTIPLFHHSHSTESRHPMAGVHINRLGMTKI
jgi:MarR-like DNA-binding transcriptional regulator SgrR of sgrS sRNA